MIIDLLVLVSLASDYCSLSAAGNIHMMYKGILCIMRYSAYILRLSPNLSTGTTKHLARENKYYEDFIFDNSLLCLYSILYYDSAIFRSSSYKCSKYIVDLSYELIEHF